MGNKLMQTASEQFSKEISTVAAAEKYHLTPSYIARLARTHVIRARKFGRDWIIDETALQEYITQPHKTGPKPKKGKQAASDETIVPGDSKEENHHATTKEPYRGNQVS
jgi:excisionase family DNA binding protein